MSGLAAELSGARLCMNVATALLVGLSGMHPYTWSRSKTMYGLQQRMKTKMMTKVILTVLTLALGINPLELALRDSTSSCPLP